MNRLMNRPMNRHPMNRHPMNRHPKNRHWTCRHRTRQCLERSSESLERSPENRDQWHPHRIPSGRNRRQYRQPTQCPGRTTGIPIPPATPRHHAGQLVCSTCFAEIVVDGGDQPLITDELVNAHLRRVAIVRTGCIRRFDRPACLVKETDVARIDTDGQLDCGGLNLGHPRNEPNMT